MFCFTKQIFIASFSFSGSLVTKWVFKQRTAIARPKLIDLNLFGVNFCQLWIFILISVDRCNRSCNALDDLPVKLSVPDKTKEINVKVFDIIRIN